MIQVIQDPKLDGATNMARDADLLVQAEKGIGGCRVYQWDGPWISLGNMQRPERDLLPDNPAPWVMRPTGGKAVLHGHDETVGLALPLEMMLEEGETAAQLSRSVRTVYRRIAAPLIEALRSCGLPAQLAEKTPFVHERGKTSDCFAHIAPNDIVDERIGLKVCGCALRLTSSAVLVQASIPNGQPLVDPRKVFAQPSLIASNSWDATDFARKLERALSRF